LEGLAEEKGISAILAIVFMMIFAIFAGILLHSYRLDAVESAADRQLKLKAEYLYRALELAQVENYTLTYFRAVAENLIGVDEIVPPDILSAEIERVLGYARPPDCGAAIELEYENKFWRQISPSEAPFPGPAVPQFTFEGGVTITIAGAEENRVAQVTARVTIFKS
jgi:hypothetical protein